MVRWSQCNDSMIGFGLLLAFEVGGTTSGKLELADDLKASGMIDTPEHMGRSSI